MASKRSFKKDLDKMVFDVIDECFNVQLFNSEKTEVTNKLIEEVIEFRNGMSEKIQKAKTSKDFSPLHKEAEESAIEFIHKLNDLM